MLSDRDIVATVAVKNLEAARRFYENTLGLPLITENQEALTFKSGRSMLFVYRSQFAEHQQGNGRDLARGRRRRAGADAEGPRRELRALRHAEPDSAGRHSRRRVDEDCMVQGSRRQYFQHRHAVEHSHKTSGRSLSAGGQLARI